MNETSTPYFDDLSQPIVEMDASLRIVRSNQVFRDTFKPGPGIVAGTALKDVIPDKLLEAIIRLRMDQTSPLPKRSSAGRRRVRRKGISCSRSLVLDPRETGCW